MAQASATSHHKADRALVDFLSPGRRTFGVSLCLPVFESPRGQKLQHAPAASAYRYRAETLASRDVRSAFYVHSLAAREFPEDCIHVVSPHDIVEQPVADQVLFMFGSRSNDAFAAAAARTRLNRLVELSFGERWTISTRDNQRFSIRNPAQLSKTEYESETDYALLARVDDAPRGGAFFIAGLGGRATEGAGRYLLDHWRELHDRAGNADFALVLEFPAPVSPENCSLAAFLLAHD